MPSLYKVLGQNNPAANTMVTVYTVPASANAVVSSLTICNQGTGNANVAIAVCPANTAVTATQYVVKNCTVVANDTVFLTLGMTLATTDTIRVESTRADTSFNVFGSEIT